MQQDDLFAVPLNAYIAGVDEAGRGPLAGPVVTAAVILDPQRPIPGLNDSKKLTERQRERLAPLIKEHALAWAIARADVEEIDRINIFQATMQAMARAVLALSIQPGLVLVDGNKVPPLPYPAKAIIGGDALEPAISAASILAKVARDHEMVELDQRYPGYGFAVHKGYPTEAHRAALIRLGVTAIHRRSYGPVKALMSEI